MPGFDETGPSPRSGKGRECCALTLPEAGTNFSQRGLCRGQGGHGYRHWFYTTGLNGWQRAAMRSSGFGSDNDSLTAKERADLLKRQASFFEQQLENVKQHISSLEESREGK